MKNVSTNEKLKNQNKNINKEKKGKRKRTLYERCFKRFLDIVLSFFALIILSPVYLIVSILSLIILRGNPFFAQYRPGKNGKVFKLYKFRSMTNKKDKDGNLLPDKDRITNYGKILRKLSIDELPQIWNILKGDMSIIGPRPRVIRDVIFFDEDVLNALQIRPGLTGLSQISGGRSEASWQTIFDKDIEYEKNITFWNDVKIFFKTFAVVFDFGGASGGAEESKREYFYCDYLLKNNLITEEQYKAGLEKAKEIIKEKSSVSYQKSLHNESVVK